MAVPAAPEIGLPDEITMQAFNESSLPLVIRSNRTGLKLTSLVDHKEALQSAVTRFGALLFRGFDPASAQEFEHFVNGIGPPALEYSERSSPRKEVAGQVYTSTEHPPRRELVLHNEQSYNLTFPLRIFFLCQQTAAGGGGTPIANVRRVFQRIKPAYRDALVARGYLIVRNYSRGVGMHWHEAFQTNDAQVAEAYGKKNEIDLEWLPSGDLRTRQVRRVAAIHPRSNEPVWFNHLAAFHETSLDLMERGLGAELKQCFGADGLPYNTYYGDDGSRFEPEVIHDIQEAYRKERVDFPWEMGDLLMLDNMLTAHGRAKYTPPRRVLVAMADPCSWSEAAQPGLG